MPNEVGTPPSRAGAIALGLAGAFVAAVVASRLGYEPIWDGRVYATCISEAARTTTPEALRCAGHASQFYAALGALVQKLAPSSAVPFLLLNAILYAVACVGFHRLIAHVFPRAEQLDRALLTAAFIVHPAFVAAVVQPGLDLPLLPGFIWSVVFALERRWVLLILTGLAISFTKETGVLLYAVAIACYALWFAIRPAGSLGARACRVARLAPLATPGVVFVGYLMYRKMSAPTQAVIWHNSSTGESLLSQFLIPRLDLYQVNYAVLILVLNFAWIVTAVVGLDAFVGTVRAMHREPRRTVLGADTATLGFVTLLAVATSYVLTRFTTFGHTRYFLVPYALLFVLLFSSLARFQASPAIRRTLLVGYAVLLAVSNIRTIDPVSRRLYGTFAFGSHELLRMTSITGECCAYGADQLVYNVEFTAFQRLIDDALASSVSEAMRTVIVPDSTSWLLIEPSSTSRNGFDYRPFKGIELTVLERRAVTDSTARPDSLTYIALPNGDTEKTLRDLETLYSVGPAQWFRHGGYALAAHRLRLRGGT